MGIRNILSWIVPQLVYTDGVSCVQPMELRLANGKELILNRFKAFGEDVAFQCFDKQTNVNCGFVVKNIKHGYFGDVCDTIQGALDSANDQWFRVMGIRRHQKQK